MYTADELEIRCALAGSPRAEQLIACLEGEIAKRDARIVELEQQVIGMRLDVITQVDAHAVTRAELAAIKAQGVVMPAELDRAFITGESCDGVYRVVIQSETLKEMQSVHRWLARLNAAPVQQVSVPDVSAMARILADRNADACNVNREDNWAIYGQDYIDDVTAMLSAAPAAPAADAGASLIEWTKDAVEWGGALNYAAWEFVNECPEKSALLFNNTKGPLRAAIMKYAEIVSSHRAKGDSHDQ